MLKVSPVIQNCEHCASLKGLGASKHAMMTVYKMTSPGVFLGSCIKCYGFWVQDKYGWREAEFVPPTPPVEVVYEVSEIAQS